MKQDRRYVTPKYNTVMQKNKIVTLQRNSADYKSNIVTTKIKPGYI